jgi:hypothetical protein
LHLHCGVALDARWDGGGSGRRRRALCSPGRLAVVEAVRSKHDDFLDTLIQYGAMIKVKEAATGQSPLHVAFAANSISASGPAS